MDRTTMIYACVGVTACALALIGWVLLQHRARARLKANAALLDAIMGYQRVPEVRGSTKDGSYLTKLERQLQSAILSAGARERLVTDALRRTGGDRAAAIRKVLGDLQAEEKRWS